MSHVPEVKAVYDAFGQGDVATVLDAMDPSIRWHEAEGSPYVANGEGWLGPDAIVENVFTPLGADWDSFVVHPEAFHDAGHVVVVEGRYTATHGETGRKLDSQMCHVWTFEDGKVVRFQQYTDTGQFRDVMDE